MTLQAKLTELLNTLQLEDAPAGASVVVYHKQNLLAHASVGDATPDTAWNINTLSLNFSTGKGMLMTLIHVLVSEGLLEYEKPIAHYWSEFGQNGKENITLEEVLTHRSGLFNIQSVTDNASDMLDWALMVQRVQQMSPQAPLNEDAESCYSALVSGWVLGALIEKVTGSSLNTAIDKYLAEPLGVKGEMYFGVPADKVTDVATLARNFNEFDQYIQQVKQADLEENHESAKQDADKADKKSGNKGRSKPKLRTDSAATIKAYQSLSAYECWQRLVKEKGASKKISEANQPLTTLDITRLYFAMGSINLEDYEHALIPAGRSDFDYYAPYALQAKIPAANGVASSNALAKMYAMLANKGTTVHNGKQGKVLIRPEVFERLSKIYVEGSDAIMAANHPKSMHWRLGYHRLFSRCHEALELTGAFGHMGYDGSVAWCDIDRDLAVAFVHNYNVTMSTDVRQFAIIEAIIKWIDELETDK